MPRDGDLTASQLADNLPKPHFGDCFLGLFLALRPEVGFPGKQTPRWGFAYRNSTGCITGNSMFGERRGEQRERLNCNEGATEAPVKSLGGEDLWI